MIISNKCLDKLDSRDNVKIAMVAYLRKQYSFVVKPARFYSDKNDTGQAQ